ncbi:MAG: helix-turn-helix transcriptional regulator [Gammaproteobacteria bacterium]|nr:helix-turn-helix transcriptional regulator [Gammaproteobacteria bacterium]
MAANELKAGRGEDFDRLVRQEELILDVTETLTQALDHAGVTRAELARRLGRSPGFVSQVFGGGRNLTLRTIADIAAALSVRPALTLSADCETKREPVAQWIHEIQPCQRVPQIFEDIDAPSPWLSSQNPPGTAFHAVA